MISKLPSYMVPAAFVVLDRLPLTPSGKVDRAGLPAPESVPKPAAGRGPLPRTPVEEILAGVWSEVLGVEPITVSDDFFALGGHSLLATQVVSRIRRSLSVEIPLSRVFERPSLEALAREVQEALSSQHEAPVPAIERVPRDRPLPLSFGQERFWFLDRLIPGSPVYHLPATYILSGPLDVPALARAMAGLVGRHEVLRTRFVEEEDGPVQVIDPPPRAALPVVDLSGLEPGARALEERRAADLVGARPFDLARGPLLRMALIRGAAEEHLTVVVMHHAVADGWSLELFRQELLHLYEAETQGGGSPLPALPIQYADFAVWQRRRLTPRFLDPELGRWRRIVGEAAPVLRLPTDRRPPPVQCHRGARLAFHLDQGLSERLRRISHREGTTLFMSLLAAWGTLLGRLAGQERVLVGTPVAGRTTVETEALIGLFVNTLVIPVVLSGKPSLREVLDRTKREALASYGHQEVPFERLVEILVPERDLARSPLVQVMLTLQNVPRRHARPLGGVTVRPLDAPPPIAKLELSLTLGEGEGGELRGDLEYATDLFDRVTVERMARQYRRVLGHLVRDPDLRAGSVSFLDRGEEAQLLREWPAEWTARATGRSPVGRIHEPLELQARLRPEAV
ncbi:MAG TPA: condensation domain-containing protein, partial [Thermoanaerobaculia bacterium]|nr:condensation domain-containing protein [Thermoanaerobaculia bacterium]